MDFRHSQSITNPASLLGKLFSYSCFFAEHFLRESTSITLNKILISSFLGKENFCCCCCSQDKVAPKTDVGCGECGGKVERERERERGVEREKVDQT